MILDEQMIIIVPNLTWKGMLCHCGECVVGQIDFRPNADKQKYYHASVTVPGTVTDVGKFERESLAMEAVKLHLVKWFNERLDLTVQADCVV